ncbi:uncharacterized protein LOC133160628 [Syngnathus typhle]|uniref:uncharacterized protein LOC133160628 n=1 Tax=Syngnathus typhle TaxID=161592 RepID=UPI002A6B4180|nr:uncharacterized protein LOC133160628 [Syngnathus typhle]
MLVFSWLMGIFCCTSVVGGPVQHLAWSAEATPVVRDEATLSSSYDLPVFRHASQPLVAKELLRPGPRQSLIPAELTALLFPQTSQYPSTPQAPRTRPVEVWCGSNEIFVRVDRFQLRAWPHPALYRLSSCPPNTVTSQFLFFHYAMTDCDAASQVVAGGQLVYSHVLHYTPPPQGYIIRVLPLKLPIHCFYNRFHYSYQVGYTPQIQHTTFMKSLRTKLIFTLTVCNAQWEPISPGHSFFLGERVNFVAQSGNLVPGERLFVDSCYVTPSKDPNSMSKVDIITNFGCMTDSRREGSSSYFWSRSGNMLKFSMDAFLFSDVSQVLYLHCSMSVGVTTSHTSKSCNYNQTTGRWEELDAPLSMCSCCDSACSDMQNSEKNIVSSPGWLIRHKKESPFLSGDPEKWVDQEEHREQAVQFQKPDSFQSQTKLDHEKIKSYGEKTSVFQYGDEQMRPRTAIGMPSNTDNQGSIEEYLTINDSHKTEPTSDDIVISNRSLQDVLESGEGAFFANNDSMKNTTLIAQSSRVGDPGSAENISTDLIPITELCSNNNKKSCLSKEDGGNTSAEHTDPIRNTASKTTHRVPRAEEEFANSKAENDSSEFSEVSQSVDRKLKKKPEQVAYYADRKGLDGDEVLQDLQIREWESNSSAKFRGLACVDRSDCNSGIEGEVLQHGQFAVTPKTKKV